VWLVEGSLIKPFIDITGEAIEVRTAALGGVLFGIGEPNPQSRRPCISNLSGPTRPGWRRHAACRGVVRRCHWEADAVL
jgi:hypothetical protein